MRRSWQGVLVFFHFPLKSQDSILQTFYFKPQLWPADPVKRGLEVFDTQDSSQYVFFKTSLFAPTSSLGLSGCEHVLWKPTQPLCQTPSHLLVLDHFTPVACHNILFLSNQTEKYFSPALLATHTFFTASHSCSLNHKVPGT